VCPLYSTFSLRNEDFGFELFAPPDELALITMTATTIDPPNSCLEHELLFYLSQFSLSDGFHSIQNDRSIVVVADGKAR
jgi:hypothetical protein